ncbi:hypothetical protein AB6A23_12805 [Paenibacillus tarimensis]
MELQVEKMAEWLSSLKGKTVWIHKQEQDDLDMIQLELTDVSLRRSDLNKTDDYLPGTELILSGNGQIINVEGQPNLPGKSYEIPISINSNVTMLDGSVVIKTDRADYKISDRSKARVH